MLGLLYLAQRPLGVDLVDLGAAVVLRNVLLAGQTAHLHLFVRLDPHQDFLVHQHLPLQQVLTVLQVCVPVLLLVQVARRGVGARVGPHQSFVFLGCVRGQIGRGLSLGVAARAQLVVVLAAAVVVFGAGGVVLAVVVHVVVVVVHVAHCLVEFLTRLRARVQVVLLRLVLLQLGHLDVGLARPVVDLII